MEGNAMNKKQKRKAKENCIWEEDSKEIPKNYIKNLIYSG